MGNKKEFLTLQIEIDNLVIMDFKGVITQNSIVDLARTVESTLLAYEEEEGKIRVIFEIIVEVMQNMLSYSYDSVDLGNNTYQSYGQINITLNKESRIYEIQSGNLIDIGQQEMIAKFIVETNELNAEELKEAYKERRRDRRFAHNRGAGLGFLDIARKSKNKLGFSFSKNDEQSVFLKLQIKI